MRWLLLLLLVPLVYLFITSPHRSRTWRGLERRILFAHRGLHDIKNGIPENSLAAFAAAVDHRYGIELDVHLTADDRLIVFHDDSFSRACGDPRDPRETALQAIQALRLFGTDERVPTLDEVLELVKGRVPLLIELKNCKRHGQLARLVAERLREYEGEFYFESFSPLLLLDLNRFAMAAFRGQLVSAMKWGKGALPRWLLFALSILPFNFLTRPDFVAYDMAMDRGPIIGLQRSLFGMPLAVWTVKTPEDFERLKDRAAMIIFEGFEPGPLPGGPIS